MVALTEAALQRAVIAALEAHGCYVVNVVTAGRAGTPDIIACYEGRLIALEVKTRSGRVSPLQRVEGQRVERAGGVFAVVRSVDEALATLEAATSRSSTGTAPRLIARRT